MEELPEKTQDYLKVIWDIHERTGEKVRLGGVAERLGEKKSTSSEAVKKLAARGFVVHEPYQGISLTAEGHRVAMIMVRRHRLIECFLVSKLGYSWDEVHAEADKLEHAVSEEFISRIDSLLGHPARDPHGDPIPNERGAIDAATHVDLAEIQPGETVVVDRISDSDPELLRYLASVGVGPGAVLRAEPAPYSGMREFVVLTTADSASDAGAKRRGNQTPQKVHLADSALWAIKVDIQ